jgi:hypothetical protein
MAADAGRSQFSVLMKNILKFLKKKEKLPKVSKMLLDVASEYIAMGEDIEDKQQYLNGAVSAWNIACLRGKAREAAIKKYRKQYRQMNPSHTKPDINEALDNIQLLIDQKDKFYSDVSIQITHATIETINNKDHVTVASVKIRK